MAQIQHPSSLNPWQQYRQACSILSHTSRASNPAWYQDAIELDLQWHIRPDGPQVFSSYYNRKTGQWTPGPKLEEKVFRDAEAFQPIAEEVHTYAKSNKAPAIGVVIHLADEFSTAELKPEFDNPGAINDLREKAIIAPAEILEDTTINASETSCRIVPYAAAGSEIIGTTVAVSRQIDPALETLRKVGEDHNFPIITQTLSAPLVALTGMPSMLQSQPDKPFVSILQYPWFTVLAFFNENAELKLVRTLQHRGMRQAANFRNALFTTTASLEFMDPDLYIVPLGEEIDTELEQNLKMNFPNSTVQTLDVPSTEGIPAWAPEPIIANQDADGASITSLTFTSFREEKWAFQDFLPMQREAAEMYPDKGEMNLLRVTRYLRILIIILALGGLGYFGIGIWNLMRLPEWSFDAGEASTAQTKLKQLSAEQGRIAHWDNLLADRSKSWMVMEFFARLFPKDSNTLIKEMSYSCKADSAQGQAKAGFIKYWNVSGFARDEAIAYLNQLNTRDGINKHFNFMAELTGSEVYRTDIGNRNITVNVRTRENSMFRPIPLEEAVMQDTSTYPFTFDLTIEQRFEADDPLAINVRKAP